MQRERILSLLGYDPDLLIGLSASHRASLRGAGGAWLASCLFLGVAAAYAAWLVAPAAWLSVAGGVGVTLLTINLLRVLNAGGGTSLRGDLRKSEAACRRFRPSFTPAVVMGVLAAMLAQPAHVPFAADLDSAVEAHREALIRQHNVAATALGTSGDNYRAELEEAGFPILRLKLLWRHPKKAVGWTVVFCVLIVLPAFWSRYVAIASRRAYELERCRRTHQVVAQLALQRRSQVDNLLSQWPSFERSAS